MLGVNDVSICDEWPWLGLGSAVDGLVGVDSAEVGVSSGHVVPWSLVMALEILNGRRRNHPRLADHFRGEFGG